MRLILKENKPIKELARDTMLTFISAVVAQFILGQIAPLTDSMKGGSAGAFTNEPNF